jgi:hypothetical protein
MSWFIRPSLLPYSVNNCDHDTHNDRHVRRYLVTLRSRKWSQDLTDAVNITISCRSFVPFAAMALITSPSKPNPPKRRPGIAAAGVFNA